MQSRKPNPRCPRCGYDQSGETARWEDQCPVDGRCPECGLDFLWRDACRPEFGAPVWGVESSRGIATLAAGFHAALVALAPWVFWRRLGLHHETRPVRLAAVVALTILALYPTRVLVYYAGWVATAVRQGFGPFGVVRMLRAYSYPLDEFYAGLYWPFFDAELVFDDAGQALLFPALSLVMACVVAGAHANFFRITIRREHLARIALYSLLLPVVFVLLFDGVLKLVESLLAAAFAPASLGGNLVAAIRSVRGSPLPLALLLLWWLVFWYAALRIYLRSPRALMLTLLAAALSAAIVLGVEAAAEGLVLRRNPPTPTFP